MIWTILLVIAVFLFVAFTHRLVLKDKLFIIQAAKDKSEVNFAIDVILISIALSYIIWYCN